MSPTSNCTSFPCKTKAEGDVVGLNLFGALIITKKKKEKRKKKKEEEESSCLFPSVLAAIIF